MESIELGKSGEKLPVLGMGTWKLSDDKAKEIETLKEGISMGYRFIDTAEMYGTEGIVGEAAKARKGLFIATKVLPRNFHYEDVIKACERSLKELGMKTIDLYQLHWPNKSIPIGETMRAMEKLVEEGKIRHIGVSNYSLEELKEAQAAMKRNEIVSNQIEYSVVVKDPEGGLSDYCKSEKITIIAYSPLARGAIYSPKYKKVFEGLSEMGLKYGKTVSQVALNWLISKGNVSAIPKASDIAHVTENFGAVGWKLEKKDIARIDSLL